MGNSRLACDMTNWTPEELKSIGSTDDFHISLFRAMVTERVRATTVRVDPH